MMDINALLHIIIINSNNLFTGTLQTNKCNKNKQEQDVILNVTIKEFKVIVLCVH